MKKQIKIDEMELIKDILYKYLEKGVVEETEIIEKYDDKNILITRTVKRKTSEIPIQDLMKIYEIIQNIEEKKFNDLLLGIKN